MHEWKSKHLPGCPVTEYRQRLLADEATMDPDVFAGCVAEWDFHGTEEGEYCICDRPDLLAINVLGDAISESTNGPELYEALAPYLTHTQMLNLGGMLELCPVHYCDTEICRDDKESCQEGANL